MNTILATTSSFGKSSPQPGAEIASRGDSLVCNPFGRKLTEAELTNLLQEHRPRGLLAGTEPITRNVLTAAQQHLKVISRVGVGWDNVDHQAAADLEIAVYRTEGVLDQAVAELTVGLMLDALRRITAHDRQMRRHAWHKQMGGLLAGKCVGIVGLGAIGKRVAELVKAFGAEVIFFDLQPRQFRDGQAVAMKTLLQKADIITLHTDGGEQIMDAGAFEQISGSAPIIVNTARGTAVDFPALENALETGLVSGACLDVFDIEPYEGTLLERDDVVVTPHIGSYAREAREHMERVAVDNLYRGFAGGQS